VLRASFVIALNAIMAALSATVQAADETLTLACQGTVTETMMEKEQKPEPISMGIVVNFSDRTVKGLGRDTAEIDNVTERSVDFSVGFMTPRSDPGWTVGSIDRVTGDLEATIRMFSSARRMVVRHYLLKCRPAQRMF
jgi:hypothetical protein